MCSYKSVVCIYSKLTMPWMSCENSKRVVPTTPHFAFAPFHSPFSLSSFTRHRHRSQLRFCAVGFYRLPWCFVVFMHNFAHRLFFCFTCNAVVFIAWLVSYLCLLWCCCCCCCCLHCLFVSICFVFAVVVVVLSLVVVTEIIIMLRWSLLIWLPSVAVGFVVFVSFSFCFPFTYKSSFGVTSHSGIFFFETHFYPSLAFGVATNKVDQGLLLQ